MSESVTREDLKYYVDWNSLQYYDQRIKDYIKLTSASIADQDQLRVDLEQVESMLAIVSDNYTIDKQHIYDHIEACRLRSATKDELAELAAQLRAELEGATGVDLTAYATKEFVEQKIKDLELEAQLPDNLVTRDELQDFVTQDQLAEELGKIERPEVDVSGLATKEDLARVESSIPSVSGLASEAYVDSRIESLSIPTVPSNVSAFTNDAGYLTQVPDEFVTDEELEQKGYLTEHQSLEGLATEDFVVEKLAELPEVDLTDYAKKSDIPDTSAFLTEIPSEFVTEGELEERVGTIEESVTTLNESQTSLESTVTQVQQDVTNVSTQVTELEENIQNNYITISNGVTRDELEETVKSQIETEVEFIVEEKIAETVVVGVPVSSIEYGTF